MTWTAYAGLDFAEVGSFSLVFTDSGGPHTATISSGTYAHQAITATLETSYALLSTAIQNAMNAVSSGYTVSFSTTTLLYTISRSSSFTSVDSGTNTVARNVLGTGGTFPVNAVANAITFSLRPYYVIRSEQGGAGDTSGDYEPDGTVLVAYADSAASKGIARYETPIHNDFTLPFEKDEAIWAHRAAAAVPWTWEHFFEHVRGSHNFLAVDGTYSTSHKLRAEGAHLRPIRIREDWDEYLHVRLLTVVEGRQ